MKYTPQPEKVNFNRNLPPTVYNGVYSVNVQVVAGVINNASTPIYFTGSPILRNKTIRGITINPIAGLFYDRIYFTFVNGKGEQLVTDLPAASIASPFTTNGSNKYPGFLMEDIDILNSHWLYINNIGWIITGTIFTLNFYY